MNETHWPPEMEAIERLAEHDPILRALLTVGAACGWPSLTVLSVAWKETLRAARRHVEDIEHLTRRPSPGALAMFDYLARLWRSAAIEETPHIRRRRHWRAVAESRIGLLCAAARERQALVRIVEGAYALHARPVVVLGVLPEGS